ncbi:hypothetical protein A3C23_04040 [Candidatus Roizmanbacteria bacterium RIFCSPHIGHO2_02_FULL_37_13b]|uniref:ABC transporter domain-containing protein n=1 Tax=Candidatus Roizmanbacteria bacterium RIFCSPLOWO2_02_FULL_36_11 TaxID=1802071 RepID=A0A1F7JGZ5_9BACT|nr:MAG: hypothetical protein A3C23_04040 [Candidatus Roizmanbacteria bacterium RIFCSPHIGHO2_02_FULL_37_13b]OGK54888.1 MAG: hypothetical protein A3H78_00190 [Candidatus Roizmanbacteria bacterium RIFCSPLOWO2_02_FULL_36_11]
MIVLDKISKKFKNKTVLSDISLKIGEGEIIGFLGPNGAGKTTTMRIIVGYLKPSSGTVEINEQDPIKHRLSVLNQIGYLPENNPLYYDMKVDEYLQFVVDIKNSTGDFLKSIIEETGINDVLSSKIEELSRGYKQRVGLAATLIGNPKIIIFDEPTSGLDPLEQEKIRDLIKKLGKRRTVILSTHMLSEVADVATRVVVINKGKITYDGPKPKTDAGIEALFKKATS